MKEFAKAWKEAKVLGDVDKCLALLTTKEKVKLCEAMRLCKETIGLTMKDDCLLGVLKADVERETAQMEQEDRKV